LENTKITNNAYKNILSTSGEIRHTCRQERIKTLPIKKAGANVDIGMPKYPQSIPVTSRMELGMADMITMAVKPRFLLAQLEMPLVNLLCVPLFWVIAWNERALT
jgi:hypothetical protein